MNMKGRTWGTCPGRYGRVLNIRQINHVSVGRCGILAFGYVTLLWTNKWTMHIFSGPPSPRRVWVLACGVSAGCGARSMGSSGKVS